LHDYDPNWLDSLCLAGRTQWLRLTPPKSATGAPVRATPIALLMRKNWALWREWAQPTSNHAQLSHPAQLMTGYLGASGASFFDEIVSGTGLLRAQAEEGLGELVAAGLVSADSFSGLRALLIPSERKRRLATRRRRVALFGLEDAGRWNLIRRQPASAGQDNLEPLVWILLRRCGVVFRRILTRESEWLPPWHALLRVLRRLEAQGHIRGGRFVAGVSGEQFALPDAVGALRAVRKRPAEDRLVSLSAADPLNLIGLLTSEARVPALAGNRVLLRDGVPVAVHAGGETQFLIELPPGSEWMARNALLHGRIPQLPARVN
jgi:ATP-dependent Lhr-like helicase